MAILTINELFIHDGNDLDVFRKFRWSESTGDDAGSQEEMLSASGETILVTSLGAIKHYNWTIRGVSIEDWEWLRSYRGKFVLVRDSRGVREYGSYSSLAWDHWRNPRILNIPINFTAVGFDEEV